MYDISVCHYLQNKLKKTMTKQLGHVLKVRNVTTLGGAEAEWVRTLAWTVDRTVSAGFKSHSGKLRFGSLAIPFTPLCQCISEETLKAVGPFHLVSMPGEVKHPTSPHWNVSLSWTPPLLEKDNSKKKLCIIIKFECSQYRKKKKRRTN